MRRFLGIAVAIFAVAHTASVHSVAADPVESDDFTAAVQRAKSNMMTAPNLALDAALEAQNLVDSSSDRNALAVGLWLEAEALNRLNRPEAALVEVNEALAAYGGGDEKLNADILLARARIGRVLGDYSIALQSYQGAYDIFEELGVPRSKALALQGIATIYRNARQYERVIEYNQRAADAYSDGGMLDLVSLNNRANAYRELGQYDLAVELFSSSLAMAKETGSELLQARILENIATVEIARGNYEAALASIEQAFVHSEHEDAKGWQPFLWGTKANLAFAVGDLPVAAQALGKAFDGKDLKETPAPYRDFHELAYKVFKERGLLQVALAHHEAYKRLDDEGREVAASANLALMNARFEFNNKELEIANLRAAKLQREAALVQARKSQQQIVFVSAVIGAFLFIGFLVYVIWSMRVRHKAVAELNERLEEQNLQLTETNTALEKANIAKMEFLATTSHEIRTPLNAIIGMSQVVMTSDGIDEENAEYLKLVHDSGKHLLSIVNDILDVSKLEAGKLTVQPIAIDVSDCVEDVANIWRKAAEQKELDFNIEIEPAESSRSTDERLLRQIVSNLISNAVKFTDRGEITVRLHYTQDGFEVSVQDTGIGIAPEKCDEIFEAFKQADQTLRRNYEGAGLGLSISTKITEALGGTINLESAEGKGSTFTVNIPAAPAAPKTGRCPEASVDPAIASLDSDDLKDVRVLVAEDNLANAMVVKAFLAGRCASVVVVENGALAVDAVKEGGFDIVLMDKRMPVMDGVTATKMIRQLDGPLGEIPVIAVTADALSDTVEETMACGMNAFVTKPVRLDDLLTAMNRSIFGQARSGKNASNA